MSFKKGHKGFRTKESYRIATIKIKDNPNSAKTRFKKGSSGFVGKHSEETKLKIKKARKKQGSNVWNRGKNGYKLKPASFERKRKIGEAQKGERNHNWKGGITPVRLQIRHCFEYRQWQSDILHRDDFTCQICGLRGGRLATDHYPKTFSFLMGFYNIKSLTDAVNCAELWDLNNGRTLCYECHLKTETYGGRKKTTS